MRLGLFLLLFWNAIDVGSCIDCKLSFPISQLPSNCTTMTGDLKIDGKNVTTILENHLQYSVLVQKFSNIVTWNGFIAIHYTDFKDLAFFKSLTTVVTSFQNIVFEEDFINFSMENAVFWVENNANLTSLAVPNLTWVYADVLPTVRRVYGLYIENNPELCLSEKEFWKLRNMERSFLDHMKICGPVTKQYCSSSAFTHLNTPLGCQILLTGIWLRDIRNTSYQAQLNQAYSTVEEVHGPIVIFRTDFTNLSFPLLHTIRSQYFDGQNSWQWQVLVIRGNYFLTSLEFPKLTNWTHYGKEPQITNSANKIWHYTQDNCDLFLRIPFFSIGDPYSDCGLIPRLDDGHWTLWLGLQVAEKVGSLGVNFAICAFLSFKLFKCNISINFHHFSIVLLILLTMAECIFVNLDYVHIYDAKGYAIPYGARALLFNKDPLFCTQVSNSLYVNRLACLISCAILRPFYIVGRVYENVGILLSAIVFLAANFANLFVMEALENKFLYVLFPLNWFALPITISAAFAVKYILEKHHSDHRDVIPEFTKMSFGLFLQGLITFIACGYSDGVNQVIYHYTQYMWLVRMWEKLFYWYGGCVMRWHYVLINFIIIRSLRYAFVKIPSRSSQISTGSSSAVLVA